MSFLTSASVRVYPSALRGGTDSTARDVIYDPESRIGTEFNLNSAVNRLTIDGSFVIDPAPQNGWLQFSIHGYYFKAQVLLPSGTSYVPAASGLADATKIYASIRLSQLSLSDLSTTYQMLSLDSWTGTSKILDNNDSFVGLQFSSSIEGSDYERENCYSLLLLQKSGSEWIVPATSLLRFDSTMLAVGTQPLSNFLSEGVDSKRILTIDEANIGEATIPTLHNTTLIGSKGTITDGVAAKAVAISDASGNLRSTDSNRSMYLNAGIPTQYDGTLANNAATATKLLVPRDITTNLASTAAASFDGSANVEPGVEGILPVANGGTGKNDLSAVKVGYSGQADNATISTKVGTTTVGSKWADGSGFKKSTSVYLVDGTPRENITIYASTSTPGASVGQPGDVWFQYN